MTKEDFIKKAKKVHGDRYDYSKVEYINCKTKVCIICPEHGEFWQTPDNHINAKQGCPLCGVIKIWKTRGKKTTKKFICEAKEIHGNKYDYSRSEYINGHTKVCIICPEHGEFWQTPSNHLKGQGCPECKKIILSKCKKLCREDFIKKAKKVHGDKYDYSKVEYNGLHEKICIICPKHGEFLQEANTHVNGSGCPKCVGRNMSSYEIIERFKIVHGDKYDYSKVEYKAARKKICIVCPEHGEFWQTPEKHLLGQGCPVCCESKLEKEMESELCKHNILFIRKKHFSWLGKQHLDFYLPGYDVAIECQGEQHFKPVDFANKGEKWAKERYKYIKKMDKNKYELCKKSLKNIYYFSNVNKNKFLTEKVYKECGDIINKIID